MELGHQMNILLKAYHAKSVLSVHSQTVLEFQFLFMAIFWNDIRITGLGSQVDIGKPDKLLEEGYCKEFYN